MCSLLHANAFCILHTLPSQLWLQSKQRNKQVKATHMITHNHCWFSYQCFDTGQCGKAAVLVQNPHLVLYLSGMTHISRFLYWRFSDSMRSWVWRLVLFMILTDFASFRDTLTTNSMSPDFCCISILCSAVACPNKPAIVLRPLFPSVAMTAHISVSGRKSHSLWNEFIMTKTICKSRTLHVEAQRVRMYVCVCASFYLCFVTLWLFCV